MLKRFSFPPIAIAALLTLALIIWLSSGDNYSSQQQAPAPQQLPAAQLSQVETRWSQAQPYQATQVAQGQVLPWRSVSIKAQQAGQVETLLKQQGDTVQQGDKLLRLSDEGSNALLLQAQANTKLRQSELQSARALGKSQFLSATELTRLESELAKAEAERVAAQLAVNQREPQAPFNGLVDRRHIEVGDLIQNGTELMRLVQIDKLKITAQIPQQHIAALHLGQAVKLQLLDGRELDGELSFISYAADAATRSFYIEVTAANPQLWRVAGASVTLHIQLAPVQAHRLSPALLHLDKDGKLGIYAVDAEQKVVLYPVDILSIDNEAAWLAGLPQQTQVITLGAGFVSPGQQVVSTGATE
ncbi:efflux RND transporter periplasmic adaptor subunit [Chromatiaceae bacterium AAb-1]|nr:efflux RND transporter periplasmic adaptor subunit [Chromatiaceae bacterium AAb-1]